MNPPDDDDTVESKHVGQSIS